MWMPNKDGECPESEPLLRLPSGTCMGFILQAVKGDRTTADAIFEDYLAGKLSEELLSISRRCVRANQPGRLTARLRRDWAVNRER